LSVNIDLYGKIRSCRVEGKSQRGTARLLGISRSTVSKYWDGGYIPGEKESEAHKESASKAAIKYAMQEYYEKHLNDQTRKHKINAHTIWRDLHYEYPRSEATYRRHWAEIKGERQVKTRLPLIFGIGEAAEFDWKVAKVRVRGKELDLHVLCVNLMYGYTPFKKAYPNERQYNLIDGLVSAMSFFQGAPTRFFTDNMATVRKKGYGKHAELSDEFKLFTAHYSTKIDFANPYEAAEKGGVEVAAKTAGGILTPIMDVSNISEVNDNLLVECLYYIEHAGRVGQRPKTVKEMTEEEKQFLIPLPIKRYEVGVHDTAVVNNQQLFKYDNFVYSVPRPYAGKEIGIIAYAFHVAMYYKGHKIHECERPLFENENRVFAEHYLYDLKIKSRSRENAFPLLYGILHPSLHRFRELCKSRTTKCYQLYMLMCRMEDVGKDRLIKALDIVNAQGNPTYEQVEKILLLDCKTPAFEGKEVEINGQEPGNDDFYVEQRDPADYVFLLGDNR
jgi:predicted transcriptional regulator